ncbi:MAG TPA: nickel-binding protein [Gaiellaceae bacterium]|nr:nickel-binding protein [Gaiellaceae bacterium]
MDELRNYLVELRRPPLGWEALQRLAADARESAERLSAEGTRVRFLRSIFVPEEDNCFFLYEGVSAEAVGEAGRRAALAVRRVTPAVRLEDDTKVLPSRRGAGRSMMPATSVEREKGS